MMTSPAQHNETQALITRACAYLRDNLAQAPTLEDLSAHLHISPYHLQRTFKRVMGVSPRQYVEALRLEALKARLRAG
ncbi:MAG: AraC family transcriptional regulator, partial [Chloroflexi bacterium]